jgi:AcrR family transcriptional regulator
MSTPSGHRASELVETDPRAQRDRILGIALGLMADNGVHAMSMRQLATACGLNVATIYHYVTSKDDLVAQVIANQSFAELLGELPPIDPTLPLPSRLSAIVFWIWSEMTEHDAMWKLLVGESLRGNAQIVEFAIDLNETFEAGLAAWLAELFPELPGDEVLLARVLRGAIYGFFLELMLLAPEDRVAHLTRRADEIGLVYLGHLGAHR